MKRAKESRFSSVPKCVRRDGEKYIFSRRGSFIYRHANLRAVSYSRLFVFTGVPDTKKRRTRQRLHMAMTSSISRRERRGLFRFSRVEGEGGRGQGQNLLKPSINSRFLPPYELLSSSLDSIVASSANSGYPDAS